MTDCPEDTQPMSASTTAAPRFIQLKDVAEVLNISTTQAYALLRTGELAAIKVGGRGQWRIEVSVLEDYIQRMYAETKTFVAAHPFGAAMGDGTARSCPAPAFQAQRANVQSPAHTESA